MQYNTASSHDLDTALSAK